LDDAVRYFRPSPEDPRLHLFIEHARPTSSTDGRSQQLHDDGEAVSSTPMVPARLLSVLVLLAAGCASRQASVTGGFFGELPDGALSCSVQERVHGEICVDLLLPIEAVQAELPPGQRAVSVPERAVKDPELAEALRAHPELAGRALVSLCFLALDTFEIDGRAAHPPGTVSAAFLWAYVTPSDTPADARMLGKRNFVQLRAWYPAAGVERELVRTTDPMAEFTEVSMRPAGEGAWELTLVLADERIEARVRTVGERQPMNRPSPAFMSVPSAGRFADFFTVYTFHGHHLSATEATWHAEGNGPLSAAFAETSATLGLPTILEDGWSARSALYRIEPDAGSQRP